MDIGQFSEGSGHEPSAANTPRSQEPDGMGVRSQTRCAPERKGIWGKGGLHLLLQTQVCGAWGNKATGLQGSRCAQEKASLFALAKQGRSSRKRGCKKMDVPLQTAKLTGQRARKREISIFKTTRETSGVHSDAAGDF